MYLGGLDMFNSNDKFNLGFSTFDVEENSLNTFTRFPIENRDEFSLPANTSSISIMEYYETSNLHDGKTVFSIHVASVELPVMDFLKKFASNCVFSSVVQKLDLATKGIYKQRFCGSLQPSGKMLVTGVLDGDDRSVPDIETLKHIVLEMSLNFEEFEKRATAIKRLGVIKSIDKSSK